MQWIYALIGLNIGVLFWNLIYMISVTIENRQLRKDKCRSNRI